MTAYDLKVERAEAHALELARKYGVYQKNVTGAFPFAPLRQIEFLLHEVAHWLTLGGDSTKVPRHLSRRVGEHFERIPRLSANSLEIDTAIVTFFAGWALGYWTNPKPIVESCRRNLQNIESLSGSDEDLLKKFDARWKNQKRTYTALASNLAHWFRPSAKLPEFPDAFPDFGV